MNLASSIPSAIRAFFQRRGASVLPEGVTVLGEASPAVESFPGSAAITAPDGTVYAYEAGRVTRKDVDFNGKTLGVNRTNRAYLDRARARVMWLSDNHPLFAAAKDTLRKNAIGTQGVWPEPATGLKSLDGKIKDLLWRVLDYVDLSRRRTVADMQGEFLDQVSVGGECLVHYPVLPPMGRFPGGPVIEHVDTVQRMPLSWDADQVDGRAARVRQGVELDDGDVPLAYWVSKSTNDDPWDFQNFIGTGPDSRNAIRVPASRANLAFLPRAIGQLRGVPAAVAAVETSRMEAGFLDAELQLARIKCVYGMAVSGASNLPQPKPGNVSPTGMYDADGRPLVRLYNGMIAVLPPGATISTIGNTAPGAGLLPTDQLLLRRMAAAMGIGYGTLTRDRSQSTFSSDRADVLQDRNTYRELQHRLIWQRHTRAWYELSLDVWIATGQLVLTSAERAHIESRPGSLYMAVVMAPGMEYVNPLQEANADAASLASGTKSLADICGARGAHWEDVLRQRLTEKKREMELRAELEIPAETPASGGQPQTEDDTTEDDDEEAKQDEAKRQRQRVG